MTKITGVLKRSKNVYEAHIEGSKLPGDAKTLEEALQLFCQEMSKRGQPIDPRTIMIFESMPHDRVYGLIRIR